MKNTHISAVVVKQEKKIGEGVAFAQVQVVELGKATRLTLGGGVVG